MQPDGAVGSRPSPVPAPTRPAPVPTRPAPSLLDLKPAPSIPTQATNKGMYFTMYNEWYTTQFTYTCFKLDCTLRRILKSLEKIYCIIRNLLSS
jgi:hypothetical protein